MAEDWRVRVHLEEEEHRRLLGGWLREKPLARELAERLRGRVVVSQDGDKIFLYAESRDQAEAAMEVVGAFLREHEVEGEVELKRWHDVAEEWEDPSEPLPHTPEEEEQERAELTARERERALEAGYYEWEVQVELPDHRSTAELAERIESEGLHPLRRWRYLVVPVPSEEDGNELAERIRAEAPPEARVSVEGTYGAVVAANPRVGAFALFGGLGA